MHLSMLARPQLLLLLPLLMALLMAVLLPSSSRACMPTSLTA
jgi:hypothetical protein